VEQFPATDTNRFSVVAERGMVFVRLNGFPVFRSVQGMFQKPPEAQAPLLPIWIQYKNVIAFPFGGRWEDIWKRGVFTFQYVKDARETNVVRNVEVRGREVYFDGVRLNY
jgi:hypothetical protein